MKFVIALIFLVSSCFGEYHTDDQTSHDNEISNNHSEKNCEEISSRAGKLNKAQTVNSTTINTSQISATRQGPCTCSNGLCGCCSKFLFDVWKQKACVNVTYDPEEFSFTAKIMMNDRLLYTRTVSGKNPRPVCVPVPRFPAVRACVRFYNIYFQGRNVHACMNMEGKFRNTKLFTVGLDCVRFGTKGVAIIKPEDGGGLGQIEILPGDTSSEDDYDENEYDDDDSEEGLFYY